MLPTPFSKFLPETLRSSLTNDPGGTALVNKVDIHIPEWKQDALELYWLKVADRCPSNLLEELSYFFAANITNYDTERQKRKKIQEAVAHHKTRSLWIEDAKETVDAICGGDSQFITGYYAAEWLLWANETSDPADYTTTMGEDGIDSDLGIDLLGSGTECAISGIVCIDCNSAIETQVSKTVVISGTVTVPVRSSGAMSSGNFVLVYTTAGTAYCRIYASDGTAVSSPISITTSPPSGISLCVLANDSFVVTFGDATDGNKQKFRLYDNSGSPIASGTISSGSCNACSCVALSDQLWVVGYYNSTVNQGAYAYYTDYTVTATGFFNAGNTSDIYLDRYNENSFIATYRDIADANKGKFLVYSIGVPAIIPETTFSNNSILYPAVSMLEESGSLFAIAYYDVTSAKGKVIFYKASSVYIADQIFSSNVIGLIDSIALDNQNILIGFIDTTDGSDGKFIVYSKEGDIFKSETDFYSSNNSTGLSLTVLNNSNFVIVYSESVTPEGSFIIKSDGIGHDEVANMVASMEDDIAPAYMKVQLMYIDSDSGFPEIYPGGTMG